jgi:hypothetical protein
LPLEKANCFHFELVLKVVSLPKKGDGLFKASRPKA